jgi:hypothetical protein
MILSRLQGIVEIRDKGRLRDYSSGCPFDGIDGREKLNKAKKGYAIARADTLGACWFE